MPPGDTIIYLSDTAGVPPEVSHIIDSITSVYETGPYSSMPSMNRPQYIYPEWVLFLFILAGLFILFVIYVGLPHLRKQRVLKYPVLDELGADAVRYRYWLGQHNPYYAALSETMKERFLDRVVKFMRSKEFRYHKLEVDEKVPVLLSGAAIQLTFGLRNYMLDYFPVIHIIRQEYTLDIDKETYYGHVSKNGIYISWTHFMEGFSDYSDSVNVGLHEMAHAVSYDIFLGEKDRHDRGFIERLKGFREEGTPVFRALRRGATHLLDDYAATNFDEFWAVSIETFFENPAGFRDTMPGLYQCICDILNQDPTRPDKIIDKRLAGLTD